MDNYTMFQFFHWYFPKEKRLWKHAAAEAAHLSRLGITAIWLPPATKGNDGAGSIGYDAYDLYDLGEFDQKGSVATRHGTKEEYLQAVQALQDHGMQVYADIVMNHKAGADETEEVTVVKVNPENRNEKIGDPYTIKAYTRFTFPGRGDKYSSFRWDFHCFSGVDWDEGKKEKGIYKLLNEYGDNWEDMIGEEKGNFDYLMFADVELRNPFVREELKKWGGWYVENTQVDGFRIDAAKHMTPSFFTEWLDHLREKTDREIFAVGEYWAGDNSERLLEFIKQTGGRMMLFDSVLHENFHKASSKGKEYDLRKIFDHTLVKADPEHSVTFVDNHDTQSLRTLESEVKPWFQPLAHALILLREQGYPCVFYPALYGARYRDKKNDKEREVTVHPCLHLDKLLQARKDLAYGMQRDYFNNANLAGWTREGTEERPSSGCAVVISNGDEGSQEMEIGKRHAGQTFIELTGSRGEKITIDENGKAVFPVNGGAVAVWVREG